MIDINHLSKAYRIPIRKSGFFASLKALFHRQYRHVQALDDISLTLQTGEIVGYIGPNGAGKSTTIKILSGILHPDQGSVLVNGLDPVKQRKQHAQQIGVVFGQRSQLWWDLPVEDSFQLIKEIYKIPSDAYQQRLKEYNALFSLHDILKTPVRQLSLGQRVKCDIIGALLHQPKVLFLDEPTIGLDAVSKQQVRQLIREINHRYQTTIILTTHDMQDIEQIVDRVILIGHGKKLYDGALEDLVAEYGAPQTISLEFMGNLAINPNYTIIEHKDTQAMLQVKTSLALAIEALHHQLEIKQLEVLSGSIDDVILNLYKDYQI